MNQVTKSLIIPVVNKSTNTLKQKFSQNSSDKSNQPAIYYIPCQSCSSGYIGETIDINRRMYSHQYDKRNFNTNNAIVKHCVDTDHAVDINNKIILHFEPDTNRRKLIESVLIHNNSNFNTQRTNYNLDCLSNSNLTKHIPLFNKLGSDIKNHNERCFLNDVT